MEKSIHIHDKNQIVIQKKSIFWVVSSYLQKHNNKKKDLGGSVKMSACQIVYSSKETLAIFWKINAL